MAFVSVCSAWPFRPACSVASHYDSERRSAPPDSTPDHRPPWGKGTFPGNLTLQHRLSDQNSNDGRPSGGIRGWSRGRSAGGGFAPGPELEAVGSLLGGAPVGDGAGGLLRQR